MVRNNDYSIFAFRQLLDEEKKKYYQIAKENCTKDLSDVLLEIMAANIWANEIKRKEKSA
jgi:hypothetical protein